MTITHADGYAFIPKRCDDCRRLFWLEPYYTYTRFVGIGQVALKQTMCLECKHRKDRKNGNCNEDRSG